MKQLATLIGRRLVALPIMALGVTSWCSSLCRSPRPTPPTRRWVTVPRPRRLPSTMRSMVWTTPGPCATVRYMGDLIHGDMGTYGAARNSVAKRISTALPVYDAADLYRSCHRCSRFRFCSASSRHCIAIRWPDQVIRVFSIAGLATPSFWLAVLLILLFSSYLKCSRHRVLCLTSPRIRLAIWDV